MATDCTCEQAVEAHDMFSGALPLLSESPAEDSMARFSIKSLNTVIALILSVILLAGVSILVVYVGKSSYSIVSATSMQGMRIIDKSLIENINDLIDSNLSMVRAVPLGLSFLRLWCSSTISMS